MVQDYCITHTFRHPWKHVSLASWKKYPCPSLRPDVLSTDIVDRHFDPETGVLRCKRIVVMHSPVPGFLRPFVGAEQHVCLLEESVVDPVTKTMTLVTKNKSFQNLFQTVETCTYTVSPDDQKCTQLQQTCSIKAYLFGIGNRVEKLFGDQFVKSAAKGRAVLELAVRSIKEELYSDWRKLCSEAKKDWDIARKDWEHAKEDWEYIRLQLLKDWNKLCSEAKLDWALAKSEWQHAKEDWEAVRAWCKEDWIKFTSSVQDDLFQTIQKNL